VIAGWKYAARSWGFGEVSINSPAGIPIYQFKTVIVAAGLLLFIQGIAQVFRCILAIRTNAWMTAEEDVLETEDILIREAGKAEKEHHI
jgi:TRAP-type mannitol/chloroaromatic compound transport system permease small subunit